MFLVHKNTKYIDLADKKLLAALRSSNQPLLAAADRPAEPTEAFICSYQNESKRIETFLMLNLIKSGIRVFYRSEKGEYEPEEYREVEADALEFLESMGFMMDNINFQKMSQGQRDETLGALPIFMDPEKSAVAEPEAEEDFISAAELKEGLEDVLSAKDLERIDSGIEDSDPALSLDKLEGLPNFDDEIGGNAPLQSQKPAASEEKQAPVGLKKMSERLTRIARLISSF